MGAMKVTTLQRIALASARNPWRTIGAWIAAMVLAFVAIGALLGGALTTEANPTNNPQSMRAKDVREAAFPAASSAAITDIVVVRSERYTVDEPRFRAFVHRLAGEVRGAEGVESVRAYPEARDPSLV
jgi:putative drug exporter of the RND superfamily